MRVLLDECVNPRVRAAFPSHETKTVVEMGWGGIKNGRLLDLAEANVFDVFVTVDRNLPFQQNLAARKLGFVVVKVETNNIRFYRPLFSELNAAPETTGIGQIIHVGAAL